MTMERKDFIRVAGIGLAATTIAPLAACQGPMRRNMATRPLDPRASTSAVSRLDEDGARILQMASLAASSHNIQPWQVEVHEPKRWTVSADPSRRLPAVDPSNREPILSIGAFLGNLEQAAGALGYAVEWSPLTDDRMARELAAVRLVKADPTGFNTNRLSSRRTLRGGYANTPIPSDVVDRLLAPFDGHAAFFAQDSREGAYLRENTLEAFRQQTWRDEAQRELAEWIRFDTDEAEKHRDGLTPATMEITGLAGWFVRTFYDTEKVMSDGFRKKGIEGVAEQVDQAGGWIVVTAQDEQVPTLLDVGRRLQRMWNGIRELGIAIHPMSQMIQEGPWRDRIGPELKLDERPQLVLRVGHVDDYPDPVSLRRPVSDFLVA